MSDTDKPYIIKVLWGQDQHQDNLKKYEFKTQQELDAFCLGIYESNGWLDYEILATHDDLNNYDDTANFFGEEEAE